MEKIPPVSSGFSQRRIMLGLFRSKTACLYAYFTPSTAGFWVFDGQVYHHFRGIGEKFYYIRACHRLPEQARGECVDVPADVARRLARVAAGRRIRLDWHSDPTACISAEAGKNHPDIIFDLAVCDDSLLVGSNLVYGSENAEE